jgi:hypothetical protein
MSSPKIIRMFACDRDFIRRGVERMIALSSKVIDGPTGCFLRAAYRKDGLLENPGWRAINALGFGVSCEDPLDFLPN